MSTGNPAHLPTVELVEDAFYWVKPSCGDRADTWVVARWYVGSFWIDRGELQPRVICGPIPDPDTDVSRGGGG